LTSKIVEEFKFANSWFIRIEVTEDDRVYHHEYRRPNSEIPVSQSDRQTALARAEELASQEWQEIDEWLPVWEEHPIVRGLYEGLKEQVKSNPSLTWLEASSFAEEQLEATLLQPRKVLRRMIEEAGFDTWREFRDYLLIL